MASKAGNVTVHIDRGGVRALLASDDIRDDLRRRAERVADAANRGISDEGFVVDDQSGGARARAAVIAESFPARIAENRHRQLLRSLDAARD